MKHYLSFLGEELSALVVEWCDQWRASLPPFDEPPVAPPIEPPAPRLSDIQRTPFSELPVIPPPKVHHEQGIEDDPVVQIE